MADYTSTQAGAWDDVATWGGGGYPQNSGDTASIGHAVTAAAGAINIGAGTITIQGTGSLVWGATAMTCGVVTVGTSGAADLTTGAGAWTCTSITTASQATVTIGAGGVALSDVLTNAGTGKLTINGAVTGCTVFKPLLCDINANVSCTSVTTGTHKVAQAAGVVLSGMTADVAIGGGGSYWTHGAGAQVTFNSASDLVFGNGGISAVITIQGTTGSHVVISNAGSGLGGLGLKAQYTPQLDSVDYCDMDFLNVGTGCIYGTSYAELRDCAIDSSKVASTVAATLWGNVRLKRCFLAAGATASVVMVNGSIPPLENCAIGYQRNGTSKVSAVGISAAAQVSQLFRARNLIVNATTQFNLFGTIRPPSPAGMYIENFGHLDSAMLPGTASALDLAVVDAGVWYAFDAFATAERSTTNPYTAESYCALVAPTSNLISGNLFNIEFWVPVITGDTQVLVEGHVRRNGGFPTTGPATVLIDPEQALIATVSTTPTLTNTATWYPFSVASGVVLGTGAKGSIRIVLRTTEYVAAGTIQWGGVTVTVTHADTSVSTYLIPMG